jgi:signal transduction histidine kinase
MSPLEILKLVGFATGAALHFYLCWLLVRRRGVRETERVLVWLGVSVGAWHFGNFAATVHELLVTGGPTDWLKAANLVAYAALPLLPPLTIHAHLRVWEWLDPAAPRRFIRLIIPVGYVPLLLLPVALTRLWRGPYQPPADKLAGFFLFSFVLWMSAVLWECAAIDWRVAQKIEAVRERKFFQSLGVTLAVMGTLFALTYIGGLRRMGAFGQYLEAVSMLSSLVPTALVAYYIYRYRYLELVIRQSFVYAVFALTVMMIYLYGIRRLSLAVEERWAVRAGVVEAILILGLVLLAGPLRRVTERNIRRLFTREVSLYRELVAQVGSAAAHSHTLAQFVEFAERRIAESLALGGVRIVPAPAHDEATARLISLAEEQQATQIEDAALLKSVDALACYALWREERVVGLLIVRGLAPELTAEKREVLSVLAGHLAVAVERAQLLEEKVRLERELAEQSRLAALGQMAATIAHEVKNPLSSIKSIAQAMREDEVVSREYGRDLDLIAGEVNRLSHSVSQLLRFARPAVVEASPARLGEVVAAVVSLARAELDERGATVTERLDADPLLDGVTTAALKEILSNLLINAAHAVSPGGHIRIESAAEGGVLKVAVADDGLGIPAAIQPKVFEPFFTTKQRGTGLGLAIVARRVRELGGTINLISPVIDGRGTKVVVTLRP